MALLTIFLELLVALEVDLGAGKFKRKSHFSVLPFASLCVILSQLSHS